MPSQGGGGARPKTTINKATLTKLKTKIKQQSSKINTLQKRITKLKKK